MPFPSRDLLCEDLVGMGLEPSSSQMDAWLEHLRLLLHWNKRFNLTAIKDPAAGISLHLLDSLSVAPYVEGLEVLDVGTGGGFPGIPLAILFPERHFRLVDASGKKIRFLRQVILTLGLKNISPIHDRIENIDAENKADTIISRAFSSVGDFTRLTGHLLAEDGVWLAMKGKVPAAEIDHLSRSFEISVDSLDVPNINAERHLLTLRKSL